MDAHLADVKFVVLQHRSGAKESQATLCFQISGEEWAF
jgi:hypothetical protein